MYRFNLRLDRLATETKLKIIEIIVSETNQLNVNLLQAHLAIANCFQDFLIQQRYFTLLF